MASSGVRQQAPILTGTLFAVGEANKKNSYLPAERWIAARSASAAVSSDKMATPSELSIEEIRNYLLENGGTARNHDVVKHFKKFLTDPETRVEARNRFKEYVNTLATIKNEEGEKYLVLKKKYRQNSLDLSSPEQSESPIATPDISTPVSPLRLPPPYRPPPPAPQSPSSNNGSSQPEESCSNFVLEEAAINGEKNDVDRTETGLSTSSPPVPPRRKSQDKIKIENKENVDRNKGGSEAVIKGADEDDSASVASGYTALHWAAKHGDENIVKLIAGTYKDYIKSVNETTNGGYTPLHIAMQFDHENIFNLLVQVYGANQEIRDYSGKKARQYLVSQEAAVSQDTFRKIKARKKHAEKDLGFLRIGSLNVRVKRTTEAFSQFLGVATSSASSNHEKIHKTWGSADNVQVDQKVMPPPKYAPIKKRRSRRAQDFSASRDHQVASQPSTPLLQGKVSRSSNSIHRRPTSTTAVNSNTTPRTQPNNDSDSDTACGFDSAWRGSAQL
uniref:ankyrin repeat domain-containing protein SOWAHC isoform X13 n=1 Tax=Osmia lignaria TaxID=473952 RepID=UPI0014792440|nr:ankyrin repeat domain-containing protein SOWAHC isoform X13 [Osmia lignaria]